MSEIIWSVQRRPQRAMLVWAAFLGLLFFAFSVWLIPHLMDGAWYWYLCGTVVGLLLAVVLFQSVASGAHCSVDAAGNCRYGFGSRPNICFPLQAVQRWDYVRQGVLEGVAADLAIESVEILHRKGLSISKMRDYQSQLGYALVLEFLKPDDGQQLQELSRRF